MALELSHAETKLCGFERDRISSRGGNEFVAMSRSNGQPHCIVRRVHASFLKVNSQVTLTLSIRASHYPDCIYSDAVCVALRVY